MNIKNVVESKKKVPLTAGGLPPARVHTHERILRSPTRGRKQAHPCLCACGVERVHAPAQPSVMQACGCMEIKGYQRTIRLVAQGHSSVTPRNDQRGALRRSGASKRPSRGLGPSRGVSASDAVLQRLLLMPSSDPHSIVGRNCCHNCASRQSRVAHIIHNPLPPFGVGKGPSWLNLHDR